MGSSGDTDKHDALQNLVRAMRGYDDEAAMSLAERVLSCQIGSVGDAHDDDDSFYHGDQFLSQTRRKISRKASKSTTAREIETLYKQMIQKDTSVIPPKMLVVLTKLMGKKIKMPPRSQQQQTAAVQQQQPQRSHPTPALSRNAEPSSRTGTPIQNAGRQSSPRNFRQATPNNRTTINGSVDNNYHHPQRHQPRSTPMNTPVSTPMQNRGGAYPNSRNNSPNIDVGGLNGSPAQRHHATLPHHQQLKDEQKELETEEALLLRECLYSLQGIDGDRIRYYYHNRHSQYQKENNYAEDGMDEYEGIRVQSPALTNALLYSGRIIPTKLGTGAMDALRICGEAGWLYNQITSYINQVQHAPSKGIVARAFAGTLGEELRDYHSLLTQYESKLFDLTLRQIMVELRQPTSRLKILALLTDGLSQLSGGHLLSGLYKHTLHGDSRHMYLVQSILQQASSPWYDILFLWTTQGVLSDPHNEFFVTENTTTEIDAKNLWADKYSINKSQIPTGILDIDLVKPAFNVGKGINFIRQCLHDGQWTMQLTAADFIDDDTFADTNASTLNKQELGYRYDPTDEKDYGGSRNQGTNNNNLALQRTLYRAADLVHSHILKTLKQDFHMMEHLFALKQFLFLGQGDFFSSLMDGLHHVFTNEPGVAGIYKHSLLGIVEGALRSTNAKYMPQYVLDRLQVELLLEPEDDAYYSGYTQSNSYHHRRSSGNDDESGDRRTVWDIFMLDYQLPDPLIAIVHPDALEKYKSVFSLLFSLKKVEFMLNYTWRQNATIQHALHTQAQYMGINIATSREYAQASLLLRKIAILRQSMNHFIVNLKSYLMFEVLEGGWRKLQSDIDVAKTLDEVIVAHDRYINGIVRKSLLRAQNIKRDNSNNSNNDIDPDQEEKQQTPQVLEDQVQTLLVIVNEFCTLQENLFSDALKSADIASEKRIHAEGRTLRGQWGFDYERDIKEEENFFGLADRNTIRQVIRVSQVYNENALELLRALSDKVNNGGNDGDVYDPDVTMMVSTSFDDPFGNMGAVGGGSRRHMVDIYDTDLDPQRSLLAQLDHNNYYGGQDS